MNEIEERTKGTYDNWTVGITSDPNPHRREHKFRGSWRIWMAESVDAAESIEQHFLGRGTKKDPEPSGALPIYVFIY